MLHASFVPLYRSEYVFNFDNTFELHNDIDVLKKMGLDCGLHSGACSSEDLKNAKSMLPKAFESTLDGKQVRWLQIENIFRYVVISFKMGCFLPSILSASVSSTRCTPEFTLRVRLICAWITYQIFKHYYRVYRKFPRIRPLWANAPHPPKLNAWGICSSYKCPVASVFGGCF